MRSLIEIRSILLAQHDEIRTEIVAARQALAATPVDQFALKDALARLAVFFRRHNNTEEDALRNVLPGLDVFGPARKAVMIAEHVAEHEEVNATLKSVTDVADPETHERIGKTLERLLDHMEHEEDVFLNARLFKNA